MEPQGSVPCLQEPCTGPYPEPDRSTIPYHPTLSKIHLILSNHLRLVFLVVSFWRSHQCPICIPLIPIRATFPAQLILPDLIIVIIFG
jgi:hypothetical protein